MMHLKQMQNLMLYTVTIGKSWMTMRNQIGVDRCQVGPPVGLLFVMTMKRIVQFSNVLIFTPLPKVVPM